MAPVNRAELALYNVAETETAGLYWKIGRGGGGVVLVSKRVEMVRLDGQSSLSRAVSCLQKGGKLAHILWPS